MNLSIEDPRGYILAECREIKLNGLPGVGSYTLALNMEFSVSPPPIETALSSVNIRVDWGDSAQRMIAQAQLEGSPTIPVPSYNRMTLIFPKAVSLSPSM